MAEAVITSSHFVVKRGEEIIATSGRGKKMDGKKYKVFNIDKKKKRDAIMSLMIAITDLKLISIAETKWGKRISSST